MEDEAGRKDIASWGQSVSLFAADDLGSNVAGCATSVKEVVFGVNVGCETKISNYRVESSGSSEHNVLGFDVPVHYSAFLHVVESPCHSSHEGLDLFLSEFGHSLVDAGMDLAVGKKLQNDVERVL